MFSFYTIVVFLSWLVMVILYVRHFGKKKDDDIQKYFVIKEKKVSMNEENWVMRIFGWITPQEIEKNMQKQNFIWKHEEIKKYKKLL